MPNTFRPLAFIVWRRILALATVCMLVLGGLHVWLELRSNEREFLRNMEFQSESSRRLLSTALWDIDPHLIREHVEWLVSRPEVGHVHVKVEATGEIYMAGHHDQDEEATVAMRLLSPDGQHKVLGMLEVWRDERYYLDLLILSTLQLLGGYLLLTVFICCAVAWVMRQELAGPLQQLAQFVRGLQPNEIGRPLRLERTKRSTSDEIDLVVQGFGHFQQALGQHIQNLDSLVQERTEELQRMTRLDTLTGCFNRRGMDELLPGELERSSRYRRSFAVIFVDLDHFKRINDQYGHAVGDQVLREVAQRIQSRLRHVDWMARYGGEEFLICMPESGIKEAAALADRLAQVLRAEPLVLNELALRITSSFGVAAFEPGDSLDSLLARADLMLYQAKADGRDCVRIASGSSSLT